MSEILTLLASLLLTDLIEPGDARVLASVPVRRGLPTIEIAVAAAVSEGAATAALGRLELHGFVRRDAAGWRKAVMPKS